MYFTYLLPYRFIHLCRFRYHACSVDELCVIQVRDDNSSCDFNEMIRHFENGYVRQNLLHVLLDVIRQTKNVSDYRNIAIV